MFILGPWLEEVNLDGFAGPEDSQRFEAKREKRIRSSKNVLPKRGQVMLNLVVFDKQV